MKELLFIAIVYGVFLIATIVFYRMAKRFGNLASIILAICYLIGIYFYFEMINQLHIYLRDKKIYLELGHASLTLVLIFFISYLTAFIAIGIFIFQKRRINKSKKSIY